VCVVTQFRERARTVDQKKQARRASTLSIFARSLTPPFSNLRGIGGQIHGALTLLFFIATRHFWLGTLFLFPPINPPIFALCAPISPLCAPYLFFQALVLPLSLIKNLEVF
jgi:hypothetical protein